MTLKKPDEHENLSGTKVAHHVWAI